MTDLKQILAGNVDEVAQALAPLTSDQLAELKALEEADKNRKGALTAIEAALAALMAVVSIDAEVVEPSPIADETDTTVFTSAAETNEVVDVPADPVEPPTTEPVFETPVVDAPAIETDHVYFVDEAVADDMPAEDEPVTGEAPAAIGSVIDMAHFAVDTDLRAGTSVDQNRIDFNDPRIDGHEVVEAALAAQIEG